MKLSQKSFKTHKKGMTFVEVMTAVVIIGIIVSIAIPNFIASSRKRAREASVKTNMRTFQVMLETYRVDNQVYPDAVSDLDIEANKKNYNKEVVNPYTKQKGPVNVWGIDYMDPTDPGFAAQSSLYEGKVGFQKVNTTKYYINGYGEAGTLITVDGKAYLVTNGG